MMKYTISTSCLTALLCMAPAIGSAAPAARKPARVASRPAASSPSKAPAAPGRPAVPPASAPAPPAQPKQPAMGTVKMPYETFALTLVTWDGARELEVNGKEGLARVAPGSYWITGWDVRTKDATGHVWRAQGGSVGQPGLGIRMTGGTTAEIRLATPIKTDLAVEQVGGEFSFLMRFLGTAGDRCTRVFVDGEYPPVPKLKIVDADGTPVETVNFKYGCGFVCRKSWKAPEGVKWPLRATVEVDFGPFPVESGTPIELRREP